MRKTLTFQLLQRAADAVIGVVDSYRSRGAPRSERTLDPALYSFLVGAGTHVERQVPVLVGGRRRRIDFRCKGTNPANLEWALRPSRSGAQLGAQSNASEVKKLSRTSNARRYLLLVDLTPARLVKSREELIGDYATIALGPGKYARHSVTVVYVHRTFRCKFIWRP